MKKRLYIFVEGEDDVRFFGRVMKPLFVSHYDSVEIFPYACIKRVKVNNFIKSLSEMKTDYIFVADIDTERSVRDKKQLLYHWYSNVNGSNIVIVIMEIESWYYAGLADEALRKYGLPSLPNTDELTKEDFNNLIPPSFDSRIDFMFEILKSFSPTTAALHNRSFKFFFDHYHLEDPAVFPPVLPGGQDR